MIEVHNLVKRFGPTVAVDNLNFSIPEGRIVGPLRQQLQERFHRNEWIANLVDDFGNQLSKRSEPIESSDVLVEHAQACGGLLRSEHETDLLPGLAQRDYLSHEEFTDVVNGAADQARDAVKRIRSGDVRHDPRDGCPSWCDRWSMCRIARA